MKKGKTTGDTIREAATKAAETKARNEGWHRAQVIVRDPTAGAQGRYEANVKILPTDGTEHDFEYRCTADGVGELWPPKQ
jgi:hypothetical protein